MNLKNLDNDSYFAIEIGNILPLDKYRISI